MEQDNILSNNQYIQWLIEFTKENEQFSDEDWDYSNIPIDKEDKENVYNLYLLFEAIFRYAKKNYIDSSLNGLGEYYQIRKDDIGFEIGYKTGQGTSFYCKRIPVTDKKEFIDILDIMEDKKQEKTNMIEKNLEELSNLIKKIYKDGTPLEAIIETNNSVISQIIKAEKEKEKKKTASK